MFPEVSAAVFVMPWYAPISLKFIAIALIAAAGLFYLAQTMQASSTKYKLMQIQEEKSELEAKAKDLEVEAARLKSLNEIKNSTQNLGLEPTSEINYIKKEDSVRLGLNK